MTPNPQTLPLRLRSLFALLFALVVLVPALTAQTATPTAPSARGAAGIIRGHVVDPTGALIPGAKIVIANAAGVTAALVTADSGGAYQAAGLPAGSYIVKASADGFSSAVSPVFPLLAGQSKRVDIAMAILAEQQSVTVSDEDNPTVNVEADNNAGSMVLKDKDLDALSDDPDELSSELTALAGPSAGPNGGEIYVGGFSGGQLPPKSAIREIRVNQNPFSAEFDHLGYGRIEILTKPGTDQLHGRFFSQGNDNNFNTGNPIIPAGQVTPYHSIQYNGNLSGSLGKTASYFFNVEQRNNQNASIYSATDLVQDPTSKLWSQQAKSGSLLNPSTHTEVSPRLDIQLGPKHTLTARYQFERFTQSGSIANQQLPTQAASTSYTENNLQLSDSWVINDHVVNETRFQYERDLSSNTPASSTPTINVSGYLNGGGNGSQTSRDHSDALELWNITTMTAGRQAIKFGTRLRWNRDANWSNGGYNGSFSFSSLGSYQALRTALSNPATSAMNGHPADANWATIYPNSKTITTLTYTTGPNGVEASAFDGALFFQDDWKANQFLTISAGLRWETQNHIRDHSDFGPRLAFAYALDGHKKGTTAKTVLRGGYGFFYDRFNFGNIVSLHRTGIGSGSQTAYTISNPTCFDDTSLTTIASIANLGAACGAASASAKTVQQISPSYKSPQTGQISVSLERQLTKTISLSLTGLRTYGVHQNITRDANAFLPGTFAYGSATLTGTRPDATKGIVQEYNTEGIFKQNQLIANINARISPKFSLSGFYTLANTHSITGTVSNSWNFQPDYRRSTWRSRNQVFLMGNYTAPWNVVFNPFMMAQSGRAYNWVSPYDLTGDKFSNDRPAIVDASNTCSTQAASSTPRYVQTTYGCFDMIPGAGESIIPGSMGTGPAAVAFNLRISRAFGIGPKLQSASNAQNGAGGPGGPGGGMRGGGMGGPMGGGPGGGGGGGRGMMGGAASTGHKYSLSFSAQALNLFNNINYGQPVGNVNSTKFGQSTSLAGGMFSTGSAARRIFFQAAFSF